MSTKPEELNIALIGAGGRGVNVTALWMEAAPGRVRVTRIYDPDPESVRRALNRWPDSGIRPAKTLEEAVSAPEVNLVMIFTPNRYHCEGILAALAAGKRVFSEKPLATTLEDCRRIVAAEKRAGLRIMTGFVLRYDPIYRKVKELLDSGGFGTILSIAASENRESFGGGASMSSSHGWRRFTGEGGPYLLEKCSHDLDIFNWFAGCMPIRAAAFCGLDYFVPRNEALYDKLGHETFSAWVPKEWRINPFTSPKDIFDNHTVILEYPNGIKLNFQLTLANALPERRMYLSCSEGTIIMDHHTKTLRYKRYLDEYETILRFPGGEGGHILADTAMAKELVASLLAGKDHSCSGSVNGLACARVALAAHESALTGRIVAIEDRLE